MTKRFSVGEDTLTAVMQVLAGLPYNRVIEVITKLQNDLIEVEEETPDAEV